MLIISKVIIWLRISIAFLAIKKLQILRDLSVLNVLIAAVRSQGAVIAEEKV